MNEKITDEDVTHMITTVVSAPDIRCSFDPLLLMGTLERMKHSLLKIVHNAMRKYANCSGKQRDFDQLYEKFSEVYGIKTNEEAEWKAAIKKASKRTDIPTKGVTCTFRRFQS